MERAINANKESLYLRVYDAFFWSSDVLHERTRVKTGLEWHELRLFKLDLKGHRISRTSTSLFFTSSQRWRKKTNSLGLMSHFRSHLAVRSGSSNTVLRWGKKLLRVRPNTDLIIKSRCSGRAVVIWLPVCPQRRAAAAAASAAIWLADQMPTKQACWDLSVDLGSQKGQNKHCSCWCSN